MVNRPCSDYSMDLVMKKIVWISLLTLHKITGALTKRWEGGHRQRKQYDCFSQEAERQQRYKDKSRDEKKKKTLLLIWL